MPVLEISPQWSADYPGAVVGLLELAGVCNPAGAPALDTAKRELEQNLRATYQGYDRAQLRAIPTIQAYHAFYKRFKKSYHVQLQLESVALQGKPIPSVAALVEAMFMAELQDLLLTAGHDLDFVTGQLRLLVAGGEERFTGINGQEQQLKPGDMAIADAEGIISSVIYGPDFRTRLRPETHRALFTTYAPPGVGPEAVRRHLERLRDTVALFAPDASAAHLEVFVAG